MAQKKPGLFKLLETIIIVMVFILIVTNLLYIKDAYYSKHCVTANILTIVLLIWATAFWLVVTEHSDKKPH